jgi:transposase
MMLRTSPSETKFTPGSLSPQPSREQQGLCRVRQHASKVGKGTVHRYLRRLESAGLSWPMPADLDDVALERCLFPPPPVVPSQERPVPDCVAIHRELKSRKNVTLQLLWAEYRQVYPLRLTGMAARPTKGNWRSPRPVDSASKNVSVCWWTTTGLGARTRH